MEALVYTEDSIHGQHDPLDGEVDDIKGCLVEICWYWLSAWNGREVRCAASIRGSEADENGGHEEDDNLCAPSACAKLVELLAARN